MKGGRFLGHGVCFQRPWLSPFVKALRCVMYFRFFGWLMFACNGPASVMWKGRVFQVTYQGQHGFHRPWTWPILDSGSTVDEVWSLHVWMSGYYRGIAVTISVSRLLKRDSSSFLVTWHVTIESLGRRSHRPVIGRNFVDANVPAGWWRLMLMHSQSTSW